MNELNFIPFLFIAVTLVGLIFAVGVIALIYRLLQTIFTVERRYDIIRAKYRYAREEVVISIGIFCGLIAMLQWKGIEFMESRSISILVIPGFISLFFFWFGRLYGSKSGLLLRRISLAATFQGFLISLFITIHLGLWNFAGVLLPIPFIMMSVPLLATVIFFREFYFNTILFAPSKAEISHRSMHYLVLHNAWKKISGFSLIVALELGVLSAFSVYPVALIKVFTSSSCGLFSCYECNLLNWQLLIN